MARPAALLAVIADTERGFDAIVVGEYERAFAGRLVLDLLPIVEQRGARFGAERASARAEPDETVLIRPFNLSVNFRMFSGYEAHVLAELDEVAAGPFARHARTGEEHPLTSVTLALAFAVPPAF